jgi:transposase
MRMAIPPIRASVDELKYGLQREQDGQKKSRLQMLYLLATGQARDRQEVAALLGVHRHPIGRWLALYAAGGLEALLATYLPTGKPVSLAPAVLASLEQVLHRPEGFASYEALRQWVAQTHGVQSNYQTLYTMVRPRFHTKLKVPRPSHTKKTLRPFRRSRPPVRPNSSR